MAMLRTKTKAKKAELEAKAASAQARRAAEDTAEALSELFHALISQLKDLGIDERTGQALERVRSSDAYARAQAKVDELSQRVNESDAITVGRESAARKMTQGLVGLGTWLATGDRGKKLGITQSKRSRGGSWLFLLLGIGAGYAIGVLTAPKQGREVREQLASRARSSSSTDDAGGGIGQEWDANTPPFERPLADKVRTRLGEDPRTSALPKLNVNVVGSTVVVRGAVPDHADQSAIEDVIAGVEGVDKVDLELGSSL